MSSYYETVPLHQIRLDPQIRTRNGFDDASIKELAASLNEYGMLQPIVVRQEHTQFVVIAGHRRVAAATLNKWDQIPAKVISGENEHQAMGAQLAENLQREGLTLADTAQAVRTLFTLHAGNTKAVQRVTGKSAPWVSKHLALSKTGFSVEVLELLESGECEDLETLLILDRIQKHKHAEAESRFRKLMKCAVDGTLTRALAKLTLDILNKPPAHAAETAGDDGAETAGENGAGSSTATRETPVTQSFDITLTQGEWFRARAAAGIEPTCNQRDEVLTKLTAWLCATAKNAVAAYDNDDEAIA